VPLADGVGFISMVHGLRDESLLRERLADVPGARWIDVEAVLSEAYRAYRAQMIRLLTLGLLAVLALVALRHRALRPTLVATAPALLGGASALGALALAGVEVNLLSLVALLMVVGMGVDYGVLLAEAGDDERVRRATLLSVVVAGASTIVGFGLLVSSRQPALFSIGSTAAVGVLACLVLAPAIASIAAPSRARPSPVPPP
jgi:predicted exporter